MTEPSTQHKHTVAIIGAGTGGLSVAAGLLRKNKNLDIAIVDPSEYHYYQPAWTLVGGGAYNAKQTQRRLSDCIPSGAKHIKSAVKSISADNKQLELDDGSLLNYDFLVIAAGIQINWGAIKGLEQALGKDGVTSNYSFEHAPYTWDLVKNFKSGTAIFTQPAGAVKCPGAPQKAVYLSADNFRARGLKDVDIQFHTAGASVFGVPFYAKALDKVMDSYGVQPDFGSNLVEVRGAEKIAVFESKVDDETVRKEIKYDILHVVPPQTAPDFIKQSQLADANGWVDVDKNTLRHTQYTNVFGIGDCTNSPNSKTAAAIKSQAPVVVNNLLSAIAGSVNVSSYDGYAACPLTTSRGKVLLAEFTYGGKITPSFPADPRVPRKFYWWLKRSFLPWFYWNFLIKGKGIPVTHKSREYSAGVPSVQP